MLAAALIAPGGGGRARRWVRRAAAVSLLLGPPLTAWPGRRRPLDPVRYALGQLADDVAYGTGAWAGALQARSPAAIRPVIAWHPPPGDVANRSPRVGRRQSGPAVG